MLTNFKVDQMITFKTLYLLSLLGGTVTMFRPWSSSHIWGRTDSIPNTSISSSMWRQPVLCLFRPNPPTFWHPAPNGKTDSWGVSWTNFHEVQVQLWDWWDTWDVIISLREGLYHIHLCVPAVFFKNLCLFQFGLFSSDPLTLQTFVLACTSVLSRSSVSLPLVLPDLLRLLLFCFSHLLPPLLWQKRQESDLGGDPSHVALSLFFLYFFLTGVKGRGCCTFLNPMSQNVTCEYGLYN